MSSARKPPLSKEGKNSWVGIISTDKEVGLCRKVVTSLLFCLTYSYTETRQAVSDQVWAGGNQALQECVVPGRYDQKGSGLRLWS